MQREMDANERVAVVTGGSSGIGRSTALRLALEQGVTVVIAGRNLDRSKDVVEDIRREGGNASALRCDVSDLDAVRAARDEAVQLHGGIDILVNNAGMERLRFFLDSSPSEWEQVVAVNLLGALNCTFAMASSIVERARQTGYGRVVNVASDSARAGAMGEVVYSATKGALLAMTKSLARELARDGVTVNAVSPGPTQTPLMEEIQAEPTGAKIMERIVAATPLKRMASPDEVAGAVTYFTHEDAGFVTGQVLSINGGLTMVG